MKANDGSINSETIGGHEMTPDYPIIIHFGIRPAQLSYAGDPM